MFRCARDGRLHGGRHGRRRERGICTCGVNDLGYAELVVVIFTLGRAMRFRRQGTASDASRCKKPVGPPQELPSRSKTVHNASLPEQNYAIRVPVLWMGCMIKYGIAKETL